jgi:hypothetical protein
MDDDAGCGGYEDVYLIVESGSCGDYKLLGIYGDADGCHVGLCETVPWNEAVPTCGIAACGG